MYMLLTTSILSGNRKLLAEERSYLELLLQSMHLLPRFGQLVIPASQNLHGVTGIGGVVRFQYQMRSQLFVPRVQLHDMLLRLSELLRQITHFLLQRSRFYALGRVLRGQRKNLLLDFLHLFPVKKLIACINSWINSRSQTRLTSS